MRVFITGATGCIGQAVAARLRTDGHDIVALARTSGSADRLKALGYDVVSGVLEAPDAWRAAAAGADAIVHAAWVRPGRRMTERWLAAVRDTDAAATTAMIEAARAGGRCRALLYTSGMSVYGDHGENWIDETTPAAPSAIGAYKLLGERHVLEAHRAGVPALVFRPGLVYGLTGVFVDHFLAPASRGRLSYVGSGANYHPTIHIEDLAAAYSLALARPPVGSVLNIVDDDPLPMRVLGEVLLEAFGGGRTRSAPAWLVGIFAGKPLARMLTESYRARNARARDTLGWAPRRTSARVGFPEVAAAYRAR